MPISYPLIKATFASILIITHPVWSLPTGFAPKDRNSRTFNPFRIDEKLIFDLKFVCALFVVLFVLYAWVTRRMVMVRFVARAHWALTMQITAVQQIFHLPFTFLDVVSTTIFGTGDARPPRPSRPTGGLAYPIATSRSRRQSLQSGGA